MKNLAGVARLVLPLGLMASMTLAVAVALTSPSARSDAPSTLGDAVSELGQTTPSRCFVRAGGLIHVDDGAAKAPDGWVAPESLYKGSLDALQGARSARLIGEGGDRVWMVTGPSGAEIAEEWVEVDTDLWARTARLWASEGEKACEGGSMEPPSGR